MSEQADIAVVGMGVMGASLARNFHSRGLTVAFYDRRVERRDAFMAEFGTEGRFIAAPDYGALVGAFGDGDARILLMVTAGKAVDAVLGELRAHLRPGDVVVDGGNSHYADTERRVVESRESGHRFVGMGVSGGERGALEGPSMMPGGDAEAWQGLQPLFESAAAVSDSGPCVTWCGAGSAGHFVKMVHNGIEYGDMQLIAETHSLMREGLEMSPADVRKTVRRWNDGVLSSYLIEITGVIAGAKDPQGNGALVDAILDVAGQKGTGRWTSIAAIELGVPIPTITAAVDARAMSAQKADRTRAEKALHIVRAPLAGLRVDDLEAALYAAKLMSYTQGFALLRAAADARDYGTDMAEVARIWKAGCIIRAAFLDRVYAAFKRDPALPLLFLDPSFADDVRLRVPALRRVVAAAATAGIPVPALAASLAYFDTMTRARGSANLIQAQRDYFGAHTYRRTDAPDTAVHSAWDDLEQE